MLSLVDSINFILEIHLNEYSSDDNSQSSMTDAAHLILYNVDILFNHSLSSVGNSFACTFSIISLKIGVDCCSTYFSNGFNHFV